MRTAQPAPVESNTERRIARHQTALPLAVAAALALCLSAGSAPATTILVDIGNDTDTTSQTGWNNLSGAPGSYPGVSNPLVDSGGNPTTVSATYSGSGDGVSGTGGDSNVGSVTNPATGTSYPASATVDSVFTNKGNSDTLTLTGLGGAPSYDFHFFAAANNDADEGSEWTVTGATTETVVQDLEEPGDTDGFDADSSDNFASVSGMAPDANGEITITLTDAAESDNNISRWNTLEFTAIPEPASLTLLAPAGLALMRRRSR